MVLSESKPSGFRTQARRPIDLQSFSVTLMKWLLRLSLAAAIVWGLTR